MLNIISADKAYVANTYARFPVALTRGKGALAWDADGKQYIDLGSGIAVNILGYGDDEWKQAVINQLDALPHASNLYYTEPCAKLAQTLCARTGMKKVFFGNSGAEANECAVKVARKWAFDKYGAGRETVITLNNSFHGRTLAMLAATGQEHFHHYFGPFPEGFAYAEPNDLSALDALTDKYGCCAVMIEAVQGEGGVRALNADYIKGVRALCDLKGLLMLIDEVQTGNGRTGKLYSYMHYDIMPDVVSTAKGLGGGLALGACLIGEKAEYALGAGDHGSTFGGNPAACAGAVSILERLDDNMLSGVIERGEYIRARLEGVSGVKDISGLGLMLGIGVTRPAKEIANACLERGVLVLTAKDRVRLLPPLNIDMALLKQAIQILAEEIAK